MKLLIASLLFLVPTLATARDRCTNPSEYTIDRRCYVTDAQKQIKPYNAVAGLITGDSAPYCSGTVVRGKDKLYVVTAKHCVLDSENNISETLMVVMPDNRKFNVRRVDVGHYVLDDNDTRGGDWAIYEFEHSDIDIPYVNLTDGQGLFLDQARSLGYGGLRIMSDSEITTFKNKYWEYLRGTSNTASSEYRLSQIIDGVVIDNSKLLGDYVKKTMTFDGAQTLFRDTKNMKISTCTYTRDGELQGCQSWGGDSGGGVFDDENELMGIVSSSHMTIGGAAHALSKGNVNLQPSSPWNNKKIDDLFDR